MKHIIVMPLTMSLLFSFLFIAFILPQVTSNMGGYAKAQGTGQSYLKSAFAKVTPGGVNSTKSLCSQGDALIIGGFSIGGFKSPQSIARTFVFRNQPVKELVASANASNFPKANASNPGATAVSRANFLPHTPTKPLEGWTAGLENNSSETVTINAAALCLSLHGP